MAAAENYVAYVGTYTNGKSKGIHIYEGIHIYDVDVAEGLLHLRKVVKCNNSSYLTVSRNGKYLYSIADEGVIVFEISPTGDLNAINQIDIMMAVSLLFIRIRTDVSAVSWMAFSIADRARSMRDPSARM